MVHCIYNLCDALAGKLAAFLSVSLVCRMSIREPNCLTSGLRSLTLSMASTMSPRCIALLMFILFWIFAKSTAPTPKADPSVAPPLSDDPAEEEPDSMPLSLAKFSAASR